MEGVALGRLGRYGDMSRFFFFFLLACLFTTRIICMERMDDFFFFLKIWTTSSNPTIKTPPQKISNQKPPIPQKVPPDKKIQRPTPPPASLLNLPTNSPPFRGRQSPGVKNWTKISIDKVSRAPSLAEKGIAIRKRSRAGLFGSYLLFLLLLARESKDWDLGVFVSGLSWWRCWAMI